MLLIYHLRIYFFLATGRGGPGFDLLSGCRRFDWSVHLELWDMCREPDSWCFAPGCPQSVHWSRIGCDRCANHRRIMYCLRWKRHRGGDFSPTGTALEFQALTEVEKVIYQRQLTKSSCVMYSLAVALSVTFVCDNYWSCGEVLGHADQKTDSEWLKPREILAHCCSITENGLLSWDQLFI